MLTEKNENQAAAIAKTLELISDTLSHSTAFRQIDERLFVIKQGSAYVLITVQPYGESNALVRLAAQVVTGIAMSGKIALRLLRINTYLRFGTFGYQEEGNVVTLSHAILGDTLTKKALLAALEDLAVLADEYDDLLMEAGGGARMADLLQDEAIAKLQRDSQRITQANPTRWDEHE